MLVDQTLLENFEAGLDTRNIGKSKIKATIIGYGEISTIFQIGDDRSVAYKRMPLFDNRTTAETYETLYHEYCGLLAQAGISLPESGTAIVQIPKRPVVLYIGQTLLPADRLCHRLIHKQDEAANKRLLESVMAESEKIWHFCRENGPKLEIALDGQLSNWVLMNDSDQTLYYIDTSTPFVRKTKAHQLDSDLLVKTMPNLLRRFIKEDTINEVLDRYYDPRKNMIDLAANLFKEQRPELVPLFVETINHNLPSGLEPITLKNVKSYYREDKAIWALFLRLRKMDRWLTTNIQRRRYEFILPGKIKR